MKRTILLSVIAFALTAQGQLIQSGFESWTNSLPDGWFGAKSNILQSGVVEMTANVHGGASAVQLINGSPHKRFTSQPVTVVANTSYSVNFWVRGAGQVRVGLYDGRPGTSSGYAPYTSYVTATANWTEVTLSVAAAIDATDAEFIFSVISTVAPDHIVIDDVTVTSGSSIQDASIYEIQFTTLPNGDSPLNGQTVNTGGIVTASYAGGYYIQSGSDAWRGVFVFDNFSLPLVGDSLTMTATVSEFNNFTELTGITNLVVASSGNVLPAPLAILTAEASEEALEGVLVKVSNATCIEEPGGANFGKWKADDGSDFAWIGKEIYTTTPAPLLLQVFNVTGVVSYSFGLFGIQPRDASDVEFATGLNELAVLPLSFFPNPATDLIRMDLGSLSGSRVTYSLVDALGRTAMTGTLTNSTLNIAELTNGAYTLTVSAGEEVRQARVLVQH